MSSPHPDGNFGFSCGFPCRGTLYEPDAHGVRWCDSIRPDTRHAWKKSPDGEWLLVARAVYSTEAQAYRVETPEVVA